MKKTAYFRVAFLLLFLLGGCSDFLDPERDNTMDEDNVFRTAAYFTGPLNDVYSNLPRRFDPEMDVMTDNAVRNDLSGNYYRCGIGGLSPNLNPLNVWNEGYQNIRTLNIFLSKMVLDESKPYPTPVLFYALTSEAAMQNNLNMFYRLKGEAHFLRAYWLSELLRNFGGETPDGTVLGIPLIGDRVLHVDEDLDIPRSTYRQCVEEIVADCDSAIKWLPDLYRGNDVVTGKTMIGRASALSAKALKARVLLYAASPAFNKPYDASRWEDAADAAAIAIKALGTTTFASRADYYFDKLTNSDSPIVDVIFRGGFMNNNSVLESENYPPGMYGSGRINVSQNFVDAFPDNLGYPIDESSVYNNTDPYTNRDPRLAEFVCYNNTRMGPSNYYTVQTFTGARDAYDPQQLTTRTGYYLKKTLKTTISLRTGNTSSTTRAYILLGMPELFLSFAEAANEAWGVAGDPNGHGFTAKSILAIVLKRHNANGDTYLNDVIGNDADKFRTYVRNERRIELSFEGHYYYDLRRWIGDKSLSTLNVVVRGAEITRATDGTYSFDLNVALENRRFTSPTLPIPYSEIYNVPSIVQNYGW